MAKLKIVHVTWRDSTGVDGWANWDETQFVHIIESVGLLVHENKDHLAIALSHNGNPDATRWNQLLIIPAEVIVKKRVVA